MKKVNLRDLYPDVYKNDHFVEVTEDVLETVGTPSVQKLPMAGGCIAIRRTIPWTAITALKIDPDEAPDTGNASGGKAATGAALCRCDGSAREAGQEALCPVLPGYACE